MSSAYFFEGQKFLDFSNDTIVRDKLQEALGFSANLPLGDYYKKFSDEFPRDKKILDKLFFESIMYSRLKNVYLDRMNTVNIEVPIFKKRMHSLIYNINGGKRVELEKYMSVDGFYLMDALNITEIGLTFLAGYDYEETADHKVKTARYLFFQVVPMKKEGTTGYLVAGVEFDFKSQVILTSIRNNTNDIKRDYNSGEEGFKKNWEENLENFYLTIKNIILSNLGLKDQVESLEDRDIPSSDFHYKKDRESMYNMFQLLDEQLLSDYRDELNRRLGNSSEEVTNELIKKIDRFNHYNNSKLKDDFKQRLDALLLSTLISVSADDEDIVNLAKSKKMIGFPTRISFKSSSSGQGSTGSSGKDSPISGMEMFHSLYIDFKDALELPMWSISWFADIHHKSSSNNEVVQTSIEVNQRFFRITFKNKNYLNKELIHHVVNSISKFR
ncbi:hypothetical protein [Geomicrobium sediminis]|uniref:Uncharacterized protein n=1 Tax=Geomicrobium sediminis TaxID=1347788 RepID=A0ABS2PCD5_9BACL|nr:hypothetical protein [Geomicrobium sediminis]MBM7632952.1 hypothetical protein [Geomicrobium sediminis]